MFALSRGAGSARWRFESTLSEVSDMGHFKTCEQATIRIHAITIPSGPLPRNRIGGLCHNFARVCAGRITEQRIMPPAAYASGEMVRCHQRFLNAAGRY
jgi:hypothetical protein